MRKDEKAYNQFGLSLYDDVSATPVSLKQVADNYLDAGEGAIGDTENPEQTIQFIAEIEIGEEVLLGALQGDFNDDPTFWSDVGQIVTGLIPIAGQLGDARDSIHALDDITNQEGYKKLGSWATLFLIVIGFVPGVGDAIKSVGRRGIRYLDNNRITKRIGEWLGDNIISPILERVGDLTAPLVGQIKDVIRRKLDEAQEIARQLGEGAGNVIDDVTGRPQLATEGAGNVPSRMETEPPVRGNEPMQSTGGSGSSGLPTSGLRNKYKDLLSGNTAHSKFLNDELNRIDALPSGANKAQEIALFEENLKLTEQFKGTFKKSDKYDKYIKRTEKAADKYKDPKRPINRKQDRPNKPDGGYHGRLPKNLEEEIVRSPDAVYVGTGGDNNLIFKKGEDIVVTEGVGSGAGNLLTSYGPSGARGESGAAIFGGNATDPGLPITEEMIVGGQIQRPGGGYIAPAIRIK